MPRARISDACTVPGCGGGNYARGMCRTHYWRWYTHGTTEKLPREAWKRRSRDSYYDTATVRLATRLGDRCAVPGDGTITRLVAPSQLRPDRFVPDCHLTLLQIEPRTPDEYAARNEARAAVHRALLALREKEAAVLALRFGLDGEGARTLEEVGEEFGITRERVRQIEAKALRKLRHPFVSERLRDFAEVA